METYENKPPEDSSTIEAPPTLPPTEEGLAKPEEKPAVISSTEEMQTKFEEEVAKADEGEETDFSKQRLELTEKPVVASTEGVEFVQTISAVELEEIRTMDPETIKEHVKEWDESKLEELAKHLDVIYWNGQNKDVLLDIGSKSGLNKKETLTALCAYNEDMSEVFGQNNGPKEGETLESKYGDAAYNKLSTALLHFTDEALAKRLAETGETPEPYKDRVELLEAYGQPVYDYYEGHGMVESWDTWLIGSYWSKYREAYKAKIKPYAGFG